MIAYLLAGRGGGRSPPSRMLHGVASAGGPVRCCGAPLRGRGQARRLGPRHGPSRPGPLAGAGERVVIAALVARSPDAWSGWRAFRSAGGPRRLACTQLRPTTRCRVGWSIPALRTRLGLGGRGVRTSHAITRRLRRFIGNVAALAPRGAPVPVRAWREDDAHFDDRFPLGIPRTACVRRRLVGAR